MSLLVSTLEVREVLKHAYDSEVLCRWRTAKVSQIKLYAVMSELRQELIEELGEDSEEVCNLEDYMDIVWGHVPSNRAVWSRSLCCVAGGVVRYGDTEGPVGRR